MPEVAIEGGSLHFERDGAGEAVIFVSGLGGTAAFWAVQVQAFRDRFSVITFDHRGIGASTGAPPYTVHQWSNDLLRLADRIGLDCFHLVGHSTGGIISQVFAAENPDRVRTLILGGSWLSPDRRFCEMFALRKDVLTSLGDEAHRTFGDLLASSADWDGRERGSQRATPSEIVLARIDALLAYDGAAYADRVRAPALIIAATDDHLVPAYLSEALAGAIVGSEMLLIDGGGHFFPRTRATVYNEALSDFWERCRNNERV